MFLSIDPGINNTGITVFSINKKFKIHYSANILNLRKFTEEEKKLENFYDSRAVKVLYIINFIRKILNTYEIDEVVIEAPFYNALTPMAFGSLLEVINALKYNVFIPENIKITMIEPLLIKKTFTKERLANKELMKLFLHDKIAKNELEIEENIDIESLTEHQIDSIAIGYCHYLLNYCKTF